MIVVNAIVETNPANIEAMKTAISVMEQASQAEPGCTDYTFSVELNDPGKLRITECWESMEALSAHFQTAHMEVFQAAMANKPPEGMQVNFYEATEVTPPGR